MVQKKLIFVVDDEDLVRWTLEEALKDEGYEVRSFENAEKMLNDFSKSSPHMILLDIQLPGKSGIEALEIIKKDFPEQLVVMITAYGDVETAVKSMHLGARDFISKPFEISELKLKVERFIEEVEIKGELRRHQSELIQKYSLQIKEARIKRNMSQDDLGKIIGFKAYTINRIEAERYNPSSDKLFTILNDYIYVFAMKKVKAHKHFFLG